MGAFLYAQIEPLKQKYYFKWHEIEPFKPFEFDTFKTQAGLNSFSLTPLEGQNAFLISQGLSQADRYKQLSFMLLRWGIG